MRSSFLWLPLLAAPFFGCEVFACAVIEGDSITAADLARSEPAFLTIDPKTVLAAAPLAGAVRSLQPGEIVALARRHGVALEPAPEGVCFERASEPLTAALLQPVLDQKLSGGPFEIVDFSHVRIPLSADRKFEITSTVSAPAKIPAIIPAKIPAIIPTMIRGRVAYSGGHSVFFWVRVTASSATSGAAKPRIQQKNLVERGDPIRVEVRSGAARLVFASMAESSGHPGESVLVRNPLNGKLFQAKVQSKGKVLVQR